MEGTVLTPAKNAVPHMLAIVMEIAPGEMEVAHIKVNHGTVSQNFSLSTSLHFFYTLFNILLKC